MTPQSQVGFLLWATEGAGKLIAVMADRFWAQSADCRGLLHCSLASVGQGCCVLLLLYLQPHESMSQTVNKQTVIVPV